MRHLTVVGAGEWGLALALQACRAGLETVVVGRSAHMHPAGFAVRALADGVPATDALLLCVPSGAVREVAVAMAPTLGPATLVVLCAKGLDDEGPCLLLDALARLLPARRLAVLSGPSFADEVAADLPTAVALGAGEGARDAVERLARALHTRHFRPYPNDDPVGVQVGGAAKNVVAVACGMARGLAMGANAEAALTTRGLAEIARLGLALGADARTLMGLAGMGDLVLTCGGPHSRNFRFGAAVGRGVTVVEAARQVGLVEGIRNAGLLSRLAARHAVDLPIATAVSDVLEGRLDLAVALDRLLERPLNREG